MSGTRVRSIVVIVIVGIIWAQIGRAQTPDFALSGSGSNRPVATGQTVEYTFTVANNGDAASEYVSIVEFTLPVDVPANLADLAAGNQDALAAAEEMFNSIVVSNDIWDSTPDFGSTIYWAIERDLCESWLFRIQTLDLPAGSFGDIQFSFPAPLSVSEPGVAVSSANLDKTLNYGRGGCADGIEDCTGTPCIGPRIPTFSAFSAALELVDDGSGETGSEGCFPLIGFTPGSIAFIDRGTCLFETKALNATIAGARAVIIADNGGLPGPNDIVTMACTDFCNASIITIPAVFLSTNDGLDIHADLATGVTATIGARTIDPAIMKVGSFIWEWDGSGSTSTDPNQEDNTWIERTLVTGVALFADGFESGDTWVWSGPQAN